MIILPHSADLRLATRPYVTYTVIALCIIVFLLQVQNRSSVEGEIGRYCSGVTSGGYEPEPLDIMGQSLYDCYSILDLIHNFPRRDVADEYLESWLSEASDLSRSERREALEYIADHYSDFSSGATSSLDRRIMYDPSSWNLATMVSSSLAHADFFHIFFNLIFFLAFAPAVEVLIDSVWKTLAVYAGLILVINATYSLAMIAQMPIPTLGLSGVVSGMIGLGAFLMPHARIRTFIWILTFIRNVSIPAWILALWFIGWDAWDMLSGEDTGGVNLVAHVSGGIGGYIFGWIWFRGRREEIREELDAEVAFMQQARSGPMGVNKQAILENQEKFADQRREERARAEEARFIDRLHASVNVHNDGEAIVMLLERYEDHQASFHFYEEMYQQLRHWPHGRALLCLGRLNISLLLEAKKSARAVRIAKECQEVSRAFVLADPKELLPLVQSAIGMEEYLFAFYLIHDAARRYGGGLDPIACKLQEAQLLLLYLNRPNRARKLIRELLAAKEHPLRPQVVSLAKCLVEG